MINQLYVLDKNISDYKSLINELPEGSEYLLLEANQNGLEQLVAGLESNSELDALHLFSHGSAGELQLGNLILNSNNIIANQSLLVTLGEAFTENGDFLIYGCNVAEGSKGISLVESLRELTGLDIAASDDLTSSETSGGNWELEVNNGKVAASSVHTEGYSGQLLLDTGAQGTEFQISTYLPSTKRDSSVTALSDGGWLVTWTSIGRDNDGSAGVYGKKYDSTGNIVITEFQINNYTEGNQDTSAVIDLSDGGWLVAWTSNGQDGSGKGIYGKRYDSMGNTVGTEFQINTHATNDQLNSSVVSLEDGGWVVTWTSNGQDSSGYGIYGKRYDSNGISIAGEFQVNSYTFWDQTASSVTALDDGGWLVTWSSSWQDGSGEGIYGQRYDATGNKVGNEFQINSYFPNHQYSSSVTTLKDGGWLVTWTSIQDGSGSGVYGKRFDSMGDAVGTEFQINTHTANDQLNSSVTALDDGGWLVTWNSVGQDGEYYGVFGQRYDAVGNTVAGEFQVNTHTPGNQMDPAICVLDDGGWLIVWISSNQGADYTSAIYGQLYDSKGTQLAIPPGLLPSTDETEAAEVEIGDGLVAHYTFDGNADDLSGNGHHGTVNGPTLTLDESGNGNSAYLFDGDGDLISLYDVDYSSDFTISIEIEHSDGQPDSNEVIYRHNGGASRVQIMANDQNAGTGPSNIRWDITGSTGGFDRVTDVETGTDWQQISLIREGDTFSLYINGELVDSVVADIGDVNPTGTAIVGATEAGQASFDGSIDEVRVYDRALSVEEVQELNSAYQTIKDGLVVHYTFDGNANDSSGNSLDATSYGNPVYTDGISGQAIEFDGSGDYLQTASISDEWDKWAYSVFIKPRTSTHGMEVIEREKIGIYNDFELFITGDNQVLVQNDNATTPNVFSQQALALDEWHHIVASYDGSNLSIYINGTLDSTTSIASASIDVNAPLTIGKHLNTTAQYYYDGLIDELRVYNRDLSLVEVQELFSSSYSIGSSSGPDDSVGDNDYLNGVLVSNGDASDITDSPTQIDLLSGANTLTGSVNFDSDIRDSFEFTATESGEYTFTFNNPAENLYLRLYDGGSSEKTDSSGNLSSELVAGKTYTLKVDDNSGSEANYTLNINAPDSNGSGGSGSAYDWRELVNGELHLTLDDGSVVRCIVNGTATFTNSHLNVTGADVQFIPAGDEENEILLFAGDFSYDFSTKEFEIASNVESTFELAGFECTVSNIHIKNGEVGCDLALQFPEAFGITESVSGFQVALNRSGVHFGKSAGGIAVESKMDLPDISFNLLNLLAVDASGMFVEYVSVEDQIILGGDFSIDAGWDKFDLPAISASIDEIVFEEGELTDVTLYIGVDDFSLYGWGVNDLNFYLSTTDNYLSAEGEVDFPRPLDFGIGADVGFTLSPFELDRIYLNAELPSRGIPIANTGFNLTEIGAGLSNLSSNSKDPILLEGDMELKGLKGLLELDLSGELDDNHVAGEVVGHFKDPGILSFSAWCELIWTGNRSLSFGGNLYIKNELDNDQNIESSLISGGMDACYDFNSKTLTSSGGAKANLKYGLELNANYKLVYSDDGDDSNDYVQAWTERESLISNKTLYTGVTYVFGDSPDFFAGKKELPLISSWVVDHTISDLLVEIEWKNAATNPVQTRVIVYDDLEKTIIREVIEQADYAQNGIEVITDWSTDTLTYIYIGEVEEGLWDVEVTNPESLGEITYSASTSHLDTSLSLDDMLITDYHVTVNYTAINPNSDADILFFIDDNNKGIDGQLIGVVDENDNSGEFVWDASGYTPGDYYIYATMTDMEIIPVTTYSSQTVSISNVSVSGEVIVDGTTTLGRTLTANTDFVDDPNGLGALSYQWLRDGAEIDGAASISYLLTSDDVGYQISVRIDFTDSGGSAESMTSLSTTTISATNNAVTGSIEITGDTVEENTLSIVSTLDDLDGLGEFNYQWLRDGGSINDATQSTYQLTQDDVDSVISVSVSYIDDNGTFESITADETDSVTNLNDAVEGSVSIAGELLVGETLYATHTLTDEDGLGAISFQWKADGINIPDATSSSLLLDETLLGQQLSVVASYTDDQGTAESVESSLTTAVTQGNHLPIGWVTVEGNPQEGETLSAEAVLSDEDGLGVLSYQWQANGVDLASETISTLVLDQTHIGYSISVNVTYTDGEGTLESASSSATSLVANSNDVPTGSVTILGTIAEGETLIASNDLEDEDGLGTISYQWQADGEDLPGETEDTITLTQAHVGAVITVIASYTDSFGTDESVTSDPTAAVANINDNPTGAVAITGSVAQGETLTVSNDLADEDGLGAITYQWQADSVDLDGETEASLTLAQAHVDTVITVVASYTDGFGTTETVTSDPTAAVANTNDDPTGSVTITGTVAEGATLTASNDLDDEDDLGTISYRWQANGIDLSGEIEDSLTLTQAHVGSAITVVASYSDGFSTEESVASDPTTPVANTNDEPTGSVAITGTMSEGETLTASNDLGDEDGLGAISYQWQADGVDLNGETEDNLILTQAHVGSVISVVASYTDGFGTEESVMSDPTAIVTQNLSANVQDGYVSGAKIFIDTNGNVLADEEEFTGVLTDANGVFTLETSERGAIIAVGGVNTDTRLPNAIDLVAPEGSSIVSPVTTLLSSLINTEGVTLETANLAILAAFGLDESIDLTLFDPLDESNAGDDALLLQKLNVQLVSLANHSNDHEFFVLLASVVADADSIIDLSDEATIEAVTNNLDTPASELAAMNEKIASKTSLKEIAKAQRAESITESHEIAGLYAAFFNRAPDANGLKYWEDRFSNEGASLNDISAGFVQHPVFSDTYGGMNDTEFVSAIYQNMLGAAGDQDGINYWVDQLNNGMTQADMVASFLYGALRIDLDALLASGALGQADYDVAVGRQDYITNRSIAAVEFARELNENSNVTASGSDVVNDPSYLASIAILNGVGADIGSFEEALEIIHDALTSQGETPVGHIIVRRNGQDDSSPDNEEESDDYDTYWTVDLTQLDQIVTLDEADAAFDSLIPTTIDFTITSPDDALGVLAAAISVDTDIEELEDSYSDQTVSASLIYSLGFDLDSDDISDVFSEVLISAEYAEWDDQNNLIAIDNPGEFVEFTYLDKTDHEHFISGFSKGFNLDQSTYMNGPEAAVDVEIDPNEVSFEFDLAATFAQDVNTYASALFEADYYETDGSVAILNQYAQLQAIVEALSPTMLNSFDMFYKVTEADPVTDEPVTVHDGYVQYQIDSSDILFV